MYRGNDKGVNGLYEALQRDRQGKGAGGVYIEQVFGIMTPV